MDFGLKDRVAVVCGGSRGSGFGIARELAREGARVLLTGRQQERVDQAVATIREAGDTAEGLAVAMTEEASAPTIIAAARNAFGAPDILVVNAPGVPHAHTFGESTDANFDRSHDEWVTTYVRLIREVLPDMRARQWGRIINIASNSVKVPHLEDPLYFVNMRIEAVAITRSIAYEFGREGITANVIATGPMKTERADAYIRAVGARGETLLMEEGALGRWGDPAEMGAVVAFLCSTRASYVTGETIRVDGANGQSLF